MKTILIAGLGNPGKEYEKTRHNSGFMMTDHFFEKFRREFGFSDWEEKKKLKALVSIGKTNDQKIILLKPQTFMNLSGEAVSAAVQFYKISPEEIIVLHDEIDLPLGEYRFSVDSSSAGHKGAQNIIDTLGTQKFKRLRIGVDNRGEKKIETEKYVLGKFSPGELKIITEVFSESSKETRGLISNF
jgi:peptidyl-tRNA hydrolase, PTH1 family